MLKRFAILSGLILLLAVGVLVLFRTLFQPGSTPIASGKSDPTVLPTEPPFYPVTTRVVTATPLSPEAAGTAAAIISGSEAGVVGISKDSPGDSMRFYLPDGRYKFVWQEEWIRVVGANGECQSGCGDSCAAGGWLVSEDGSIRVRVSADISVPLSAKKTGQFLYELPAGNYYYSMYSHCRYDVTAYWLGSCDGPCQIPPTVTPVPTATLLPKVFGVVAVEKLYLRQAPYDDAEIIDLYRQGTRLEILGAAFDASWLLVNTPEGRAGWMASEYIQMEVPKPTIREVAVPTRVPTHVPTPNTAVPQRQ